MKIKLKKQTSFQVVLIVLVALTLASASYNSLAISKLKENSGNPGSGIPSGNGGVATSLTAVDVIPKGVPRIYGEELGVSYDGVTPNDPQLTEQTIRTLAVLDQQIELSGDALTRYIEVASQISCEYCCGAPAIIDSKGNAACGCAHSYAMRGVAKYLLSKHASEFTDDEILEEMGKWKTLFFPSQLSQKAQVLKDKSIELNYINLASNKYRGVEQGVSGGMVGGC
ncbi:MAG TPA: hypothetical protein VJB90_01250 [Candidatus Nanoarchaeia archaeon]|nr:hypothetical protein [Candidatus Nanoarchaeia archaeon]